MGRHPGRYGSGHRSGRYPITTNTVAAPSGPVRTPRGRERTCDQCGATYRSIRSNSRFCATPCRKRAHRGTAATGGPKSGPGTWSPISRALHKAGYIGPIGPVSSRVAKPPTFGLLVGPRTAHEELAYQFNRKGWGVVTREEFDATLRADGIRGFTSRSPESNERKRWQDRQRQRLARTE